MRRFGVLLVVAVLASACAGGQPATGESTAPAAERVDEVQQISVDGQQRSYRLLVPSSVQAPAPAIVALHGAGGSPDTMAQASQFDRVATRNGIVVAYPAAIAAGSTWNVGFCCGPAAGSSVDDLGFLDRVVQTLRQDPRVDPDRVFLVGVSNGAVLAYRYACEHPDRVASVASVAGTMLLDDCQPPETVSVLEIHGTADQIVPFDGGDLPDGIATAATPAIPDVLARWAKLDGCTRAPDVVTEDPVTTTTWASCDEGATVELITVEGGRHAWYATEFGPVQGAVDASNTIIGFLGLADGS